MLAPTTEIAQKATLLEHLWNDEFVEGFQAMAQWSRDHVPFPGAAFRQLVELLVRENALMSGSIRVGYREIALERARGDVLVAMARARQRRAGGRHRARAEPRRAIPRGARRCGCPGGHVTFGTGKSAFKHTMPRLTEWITAHSDDRPDGEEA